MKSIARLLYQPYKLLVFMPLLAVSTCVCATMAVVLALVSTPRFASMVAGGAWARFNSLITPMLVTVAGRHHIDPRQSYVIVSNHQSHYDIFVLYGWLGVDFKWVMKQELRKVPAIGFSCERLGHIFIDRRRHLAAIASIEHAKQRIVNGTSVLFFAEGTRSRDGRLSGFKKGAFRMALDLQLPILPITVDGTYKILPPETIDLFPGRARLTIHEPVDTSSYTEQDMTQLMETVRKAIAQPLQLGENITGMTDPQR